MGRMGRGGGGGGGGGGGEPMGEHTEFHNFMKQPPMQKLNIAPTSTENN